MVSLVSGVASFLPYIGRRHGLSGNSPPLTAGPVSNIPGVALYFYSLTTLRQQLALVPAFALTPSSLSPSSTPSTSALPKLSSHGNLIAGAVARVGVGFVLNPFSVLKARYEVRHPEIKPLPSVPDGHSLTRAITTRTGQWAKPSAPSSKNPVLEAYSWGFKRPHYAMRPTQGYTSYSMN